MPAKHNDKVTVEELKPNEIAMALGGYQQLLARAKRLKPGHAVKITREPESQRTTEGMRNHLLRKLDEEGLSGEFRTMLAGKDSFIIIRAPKDGETIPGL